MELKHISLCSGIGGIDLAAEWAGFTTVAQCEIDEYASKVLAKNFKGVPNLHDIRTVTNAGLRTYGIAPETITILSAGFPCQPYSLAGKGKGDCDERDLWEEVARCIGEIRPRWFVGENTPGLFSRSNQRYFNRILRDLTEMGYRVSWGMWGACDVGAPHKRERVFIAAYDSNVSELCEKCEISARTNPEFDGICREISDTACKRRNTSKIQRRIFDQGRHSKTRKRIYRGRLQSFRICGGISDAYGYRLGKYRSEKKTQKNTSRRDNYRRRMQEDAIRRRWEIEPDVGRVANGIPARVDRLRCLGNAVVPQQVYPLLAAIANYERSR